MSKCTLNVRVVHEVKKPGQQGVGGGVRPGSIEVKSHSCQLFLRKSDIITSLNIGRQRDIKFKSNKLCKETEKHEKNFNSPILTFVVFNYE